MPTFTENAGQGSRDVATIMSHTLIDAGIDVGDERDAILHLVSAGFTSPDINAHLDAAIDLVRAHRAASPLLDVA